MTCQGCSFGSVSVGGFPYGITVDTVDNSDVPNGKKTIIDFGPPVTPAVGSYTLIRNGVQCNVSFSNVTVYGTNGACYQANEQSPCAQDDSCTLDRLSIAMVHNGAGGFWMNGDKIDCDVKINGTTYPMNSFIMASGPVAILSVNLDLDVDCGEGLSIEVDLSSLVFYNNTNPTPVLSFSPVGSLPELTFTFNCFPCHESDE